MDALPKSNPEATNGHQRTETTAYQQFKDEILYWVHLLGFFGGVDVLDPKYRPNFMTAISMLSPILTFVLCVLSSYLSPDIEIRVGASAISRAAIKVYKIIVAARIHT